MQNNVTAASSSAHVKGIVSTEEVNSTDVAEDVAEDVDTAQPEVNAQRKEVDATATPTGIARTQEVSARHAQKAARKRLPSPT